MEPESAPLPERPGWYYAFGSPPWGWLYFARIDGKKVTYFLLEYESDGLRKKIVQLREKEGIRTFFKLEPEADAAFEQIETKYGPIQAGK